MRQGPLGGRPGRAAPPHLPRARPSAPDAGPIPRMLAAILLLWSPSWTACSCWRCHCSRCQAAAVATRRHALTWPGPGGERAEAWCHNKLTHTFGLSVERFPPTQRQHLPSRPPSSTTATDDGGGAAAAARLSRLLLLLPPMLVVIVLRLLLQASTVLAGRPWLLRCGGCGRSD